MDIFNKYIHDDYKLSIVLLLGILTFLIIKFIINFADYIYTRFKYSKHTCDVKNLRGVYKNYNDISLPYVNHYRNKISCLKRCENDNKCKGVYIWNNNDIIKCSLMNDIMQSIYNTSQHNKDHTNNGENNYGNIFIKNNE